MIATFSLSKHVLDNIEHKPSSKSVSINFTDGNQRVSIIWDRDRFVEWVDSLRERTNKMNISSPLPPMPKQCDTPMPKHEEGIDTNAPCRS